MTLDGQHSALHVAHKVVGQLRALGATAPRLDRLRAAGRAAHWLALLPTRDPWWQFKKPHAELKDMQHGETVIGEAEPDRNYSGILGEHLKLADITTSKLTVSNPFPPGPIYINIYLKTHSSQMSSRIRVNHVICDYALTQFINGSFPGVFIFSCVCFCCLRWKKNSDCLCKNTFCS